MKSYLVKYTTRFSGLKYEEEIVLKSPLEEVAAKKDFRRRLKQKETIRIAALPTAPEKFRVEVVIYEMTEVAVN